MTQARPMFPNTVDSTIMSTFRSCPQKAFRQYVQHWKPQEQSVHLVAGGAFASGIEAARNAFYLRGASPEDAEAEGITALLKHYGDFQCPPESSKSPERMVGALEFYFGNYPLGADGAEPIQLAGGGRGIEFSFAEPISVPHPVTGDPILYTGRADMVAHWGGGVYVYDEKTTSSLGSQWARQWEMRSQFTGYLWALHQKGIKAGGAVVRGVSILKTKYDTLEVHTYRTEHEIELWHNQLIRDVQRMIRMWEEGYWDYSLDAACVEYGNCSFQRVCKSSEPESVLPVYFTPRVWDPLARKEMTVAEFEASWGHVRGPDEPPAPGELRDGSLQDSAEMQDSFKQLLGGV